MSFTVKDALEMEIFQKCRLLTGESGQENELRWVNILEILDDLSHIEPGEFLITTAHGFNVQDKNMQRSMFELFASRKLAAIAIQTGHYIEEIPASFIRFAEDYSIPLIEIPPDISFKSITRSLMNELVRHNKTSQELAELDSKNVLFESQLTEMKQMWNSLLSTDHPESLSIELERYGIISANPITVLELSINRSTAQTDPHEITSSSSITHAEKTLAKILMQRHISFLIGAYENHIILLVQSNRLEQMLKNGQFHGLDPAFGNQLLNELSLLLPEYEIFMGASNIHNNVGELTAACYEAGKALHAAKLGLPDGSNLVSYKNLGFYRLIMDTKNIETLKALCSETIAPVLKYDQSNKGSLLDTLKVYLNYCNIKKASEDMFVHRHTMRYRLKQVKYLTGYDPLIPAESAQLNLGLHIYYYLEKRNLLE